MHAIGASTEDRSKSKIIKDLLNAKAHVNHINKVIRITFDVCVWCAL